MSHTSGRHARPRTPLLRRGATAAVVAAAGGAVGLLGTAAAQAATAPSGTTAVTSYTVAGGDTLSGIAVKEHVPGGYKALAAANHIASPYTVKPGERLVLPAGSYVTTPTTTRLPFPVPVAVGDATQVITVDARGSDATVQLWQKTGTTWKSVYATVYARVGANGITNGATRVQGSNTTPTGTYTITQGFGVGADPDTKMPYHVVTSEDWWDEDPTSAYYNQMREASQGGFHLTQDGPDGSEQLIDYPVQYHNALVINFNMDPAVRGRGAGIFLHDLGPEAGPTAGCVAVPEVTMTRIMQWIDPAQHPVIAIG